VSAAAWIGSAFGIVVIAASAVLLYFAGRHSARIPGSVHPWVHRLLILGMYTGGCTVALTALGVYVIGAELRVVGFAAGLLGGTPGAVYVFSVIAGLVAVAVVIFGAVLEPGPGIAWWALALPFVCALSGGHLHGMLTVFPVTDWSSTVASWIGGRPGAGG
jgi:hypothetical protein